ncbi:DUF3592 domain-containing protein [Catenulispora sp. NL8]|uniref:DUF3592 domain-containing protein n=2 Tax=Catenulispora pinistramenti TaxID=2705254 RepID=A0ABS5KXW9_9ACTN|nr:DUF3592 domain-containing protein [Catenulispora pinistramenti]MBS2550911.1 DUF3592 domain-containing protein [Catenulispora pinistramenti]
MLVLGCVLLLGGLIAVLAGAMDLRWRRHVLADGVSVFARIVDRPLGPDDSPDGYRPILTFTTEDGRPVEVFSPRRLTGEAVLVHYDPADPAQVVVHGSRGRRVDVAFVAAGVVAFVGAVVAMVLVG